LREARSLGSVPGAVKPQSGIFLSDFLL